MQVFENKRAIRWEPGAIWSFLAHYGIEKPSGCCLSIAFRRGRSDAVGLSGHLSYCAPGLRNYMQTWCRNL